MGFPEPARQILTNEGRENIALGNLLNCNNDSIDALIAMLRHPGGAMANPAHAAGGVMPKRIPNPGDCVPS